MKTISKLLLAVCFLSVVDANAELKRYLVKLENTGTTTGQHRTDDGFLLKEGEAIVIKSVNGNRWPTLENVNNFVYYLRMKVIYPDLGLKSPMLYSLDELGSNEKKETQYPIIVGPAKISFESNEKHPQALVYDLIKTSTSNPFPHIPNNTVVVPADASGPVQVILESSKDLVNWTRAEPGTYGAKTQNRFFRVRAVVKP